MPPTKEELACPCPLASYPCHSHFSCHCRSHVKSLCCCVAEVTFLWSILSSPSPLPLFSCQYQVAEWGDLQAERVRMRKGILLSPPRAMTGFVPPLLELSLAKGKKNYIQKGSRDIKEEGKKESQEFFISHPLPFSLSCQPFSSSTRRQASYPRCLSSMILTKLGASYNSFLLDFFTSVLKNFSEYKELHFII